MKKPDLHQYFTPAWAAELLVSRFFGDLDAQDVVWEPSCGDGRFLLALPPDVAAFGTELDPHWAAQARTLTGRPVVTGDFRTAELPAQPTAVIGNPPYEADLIDALLARCLDLLEYERRVGLLLPCYYLQTASKVVDLGRRWSLAQVMLPKNLFQDMSKPLMWATFTKARRPFVSGFFLHAEVAALAGMHPEFRAHFLGNQSTPTCWRDAVQMALELHEGRATLQQLYAAIEGNRPSENQWWREKVRQVAGQHFVRVQPGEYALPEAA